MDPLVFRLGHPYPVHNEANGQEKARVDLTPAFFSVCCYLCNPAPVEVAAWQGPFEYGLYEAAPGVPFVLIRLLGGRWLFDVSLNWHLMASPDERAVWAEHEEPTPLTLALIDARTNHLRAYRRFAPSPAFVAALRAAARRQVAAFADHRAVAQAISQAEAMPLQLMSRRATYFPVPT